MSSLEAAGSRKSREHYEKIVGDYEKRQEEIMKNVSEWYCKYIEEKKEVVSNGERDEERKFEFNGFPKDW